jgi:hypothetical protein
MYVSATSKKSNEMFLIELPFAKSKDVLASFNQDLNFMVENLDIVKNRLVILNPSLNLTKKKSSRKTTGNNEIPLIDSKKQSATQDPKNNVMDEPKDDEDVPKDTANHETEKGVDGE